MRSLLLALMPREGRYQITGRVGSGLVEEVRVLLFERLSKRGRAVFIRYLESSFSIAAAMRFSSSCAAPSDPRTMRPLRSIMKERGTPCSA